MQKNEKLTAIDNNYAVKRCTTNVMRKCTIARFVIFFPVHRVTLTYEGVDNKLIYNGGQLINQAAFPRLTRALLYRSQAPWA